MRALSYYKDMSQDSISIQQKALTINEDVSVYGTFAEIGAGQEVARYFFLAGHASQTVAKSMSAYDMTFSDAIYGKDQRYVSEPRVMKMLDHEYQLLVDRLVAQRGSTTRFFAFADTVATSRDLKRSHGWMGIRFQMRPGGPVNDVVLHVKLKDSNRLQQQEALGMLGVNFIFASLYFNGHPADFTHQLVDCIGSHRIEVDYLSVSGPDFAQVDNRRMSLQLIDSELTDALIFSPDGQVCQASDVLFGKPLLVMRGTFRPVTTTHTEIVQASLKQLQDSGQLAGEDVNVLFEISLSQLMTGGEFDHQDFLNRVDTLTALNHHVMISKYQLFYQLKRLLRRSTDRWITMVIGAGHLERLFDTSYYSHLPGGILHAFGELFDEKTQLFVYPFKDDNVCLTTKSFFPDQKLASLYQYLLQNQRIVDILNCDSVDTSIHSDDVRRMLTNGDDRWESLVPKEVCKLIKTKALFGYNSSQRR